MLAAGADGDAFVMAAFLTLAALSEAGSLRAVRAGRAVIGGATGGEGDAMIVAALLALAAGAEALPLDAGFAGPTIGVSATFLARVIATQFILWALGIAGAA